RFCSAHVRLKVPTYEGRRIWPCNDGSTALVLPRKSDSKAEAMKSRILAHGRAEPNRLACIRAQLPPRSVACNRLLSEMLTFPQSVPSTSLRSGSRDWVDCRAILCVL